MLTSNLTTMGGYVLGIVNAMEQKGMDSQELLSRAGIERRPRNDPMDRLYYRHISELFAVCVESTKDPCVGIDISRYLNISHFHAVGCSLAASASLLDLCQRIERYSRIVSDVGKVNVEVEKCQVKLNVEMADDICFETQDTSITFILRLMRSLHKTNLHPIKMDLIRPVPKPGATPFEDFFRCPVRFGQARVSFYFDRDVMNEPLAGENAELAQHNDSLNKKYLALLDRSDFAKSVTSKITELVPQGKVSKKIVADHLNVSVNCLQNKLAKQNTSYSEVYDEVRKELACSYLIQRHMSICEVAYQLGFTDTSNFTRAFKRWVGVSPSEFRFEKLAS